MKRLNLFIYSVLFMLSMSNAFAQSSSEIENRKLVGEFRKE